MSDESGSVFAKYKVRVWGGYSGSHGFVTASKLFTLPVIPFCGMTLYDNDRAFWFPESIDVQYDTSTGDVSCMSKEFCDADFPRDATLEYIRDWYAQNGWKIEETGRDVV